MRFLKAIKNVGKAYVGVTKKVTLPMWKKGANFLTAGALDLGKGGNGVLSAVSNISGRSDTTAIASTELIQNAVNNQNNSMKKFMDDPIGWAKENMAYAVGGVVGIALGIWYFFGGGKKTGGKRR